MSSNPVKLELKTSEDPEIQWAFPEVDPEFYPFGGRVLVQVRRVAMKTRSGIYVAPEAQETERWNVQVAKVRAVGPLAFKKKESMEDWAEGVWAKVGDFVRIPKYGADRWEVPVPGEEEPALFVVINDYELLGKVTGNPLNVRAYL